MHTAPHPMSVSIPLWTPLHRRAHAALAGVASELRRHWLATLEARAARRRARLQQALVDTLDPRTLRDIGLGDWAANTRDDGSAVFRREVDLRNF